MKRAVLSVTLRGLRTARKIHQGMGGDLYTLEKFCLTDDKELLPITGPLKDFMGEIFNNYDEIIMIMATGIAVRSIAPYIRSKMTDPAVVVLDEQGKSVISLLSGHIGGANELARRVAGITGGQAVITTASDCLGMASVDMIAKRNQLIMEDLEQVKKVTACLVNGGKAFLVNESSLNLRETTLNHSCLEEISLDTLNSSRFTASPPDALVYVGYQEELYIKDLSIPIAKLRPQSLILGVGCRKNTSEAALINGVKTFLIQHNISPISLKAIATVDVKKDEQALKVLAEKMSLPLFIVNRDEILPIENRFPCSDFVKSTIRVGCVAEPAAFIISKEGKKVVGKKAFNGITLCLYEEKRRAR